MSCSVVPPVEGGVGSSAAFSRLLGELFNLPQFRFSSLARGLVRGRAFTVRLSADLRTVDTT